jgi:hypothetical protein
MVFQVSKSPPGTCEKAKPVRNTIPKKVKLVFILSYFR